MSSNKASLKRRLWGKGPRGFSLDSQCTPVVAGWESPPWANRDVKQVRTFLCFIARNIVWLGLCCLITPGYSNKTFGVMYDYTFF